MVIFNHLDILKQGFEIWNHWRINNPDIKPDLSSANLREINFHNMDLSQVIFWNANFIDQDLSYTNFKRADFSGANLKRANISHANLRGAKLVGADFSSAILQLTDMSGSDLAHANFNDADLSNANLNRAELGHTNFIGTILNGTNFKEATCDYTVFVDINFSTINGLDTVRHNSPSYLATETIFRSKGKIPEIFLRGCGVPETLITFLPSMMEEAIQFYSCFISYSHDDKEFAKRLHDRLQGMGIRCWLDEHQLKPGDELHKTIYEGIRVYDKVILCCSETALKSWWVEKEFKNAISKEEDFTETVLIPITLDDYLFNQSADDWAVGEIKRRFVQDFRNWKDHDAFEKAFVKVVKALRTDGGKLPPPASKLTRRK